LRKNTGIEGEQFVYKKDSNPVHPEDLNLQVQADDIQCSTLV
jgi:hypothetical protein